VSKDSSIKPAEARAIVEAVLLTATDPISSSRLVALFEEYNGRDVRDFVDELNKEYSQEGRSFSIIEIGGGFQIATRENFGPWLRKFHNNPNQIRLSQAALESLAIVAFKQPITRIEIDAIRGVNSGGVMQTLMELKMVRIVGRSEGVGKPMLFGTTRDFLLHFGLKSLVDLPKAKELDELLASGEDKAELRRHLADGLADLEVKVGTPDQADVDQESSANVDGFSSEEPLSENSSLPVENIDGEADSMFKEASDEDS
jgi:segregation and condensation protein B